MSRRYEDSWILRILIKRPVILVIMTILLWGYWVVPFVSGFVILLLILAVFSLGVSIAENQIKTDRMDSKIITFSSTVIAVIITCTHFYGFTPVNVDITSKVLTDSNVTQDDLLFYTDGNSKIIVVNKNTGLMMYAFSKMPPSSVSAVVKNDAKLTIKKQNKLLDQVVRETYTVGKKR